MASSRSRSDDGVRITLSSGDAPAQGAGRERELRQANEILRKASAYFARRMFPLELVARSFLADSYPGGQKKSRPSEKRAAF